MFVLPDRISKILQPGTSLESIAKVAIEHGQHQKVRQHGVFFGVPCIPSHGLLSCRLKQPTVRRIETIDRGIVLGKRANELRTDSLSASFVSRRPPCNSS